MIGNKLKVSLYRYNPEEDKFPYMKEYTIQKPDRDIMVLDLLHLLKEDDQSISYRRSCREGVCGSDGMNINGKNGLACITPISSVIKRNKIGNAYYPGRRKLLWDGGAMKITNYNDANKFVTREYRNGWEI